MASGDQRAFDATVRGYTSRDLRDVGGSSLTLSLTSPVTPGAYAVVLQNLKLPTTAATGIASVSGSGSGTMEVMVMARPVFGGKHMAALAENELARLHPPSCTNAHSAPSLSRLPYARGRGKPCTAATDADIYLCARPGQVLFGCSS